MPSRTSLGVHQAVHHPACTSMCGEEDDDYCAPKPDIPLISGHTCCRLGVHINDVVSVTDAIGEKPRVGYFEDFDDRWGAALIWMDGSRTWYAWDRWDKEKHPGWRFELADPELFIREHDFAVAPPEHGRGWLPRPPAHTRPRARKMTLGQARMAASAYASGELCGIRVCQLASADVESPCRPEDLRLTHEGPRGAPLKPLNVTALGLADDGDRG